MRENRENRDIQQPKDTRPPKKSTISRMSGRERGLLGMQIAQYEQKLRETEDRANTKAAKRGIDLDALQKQYKEGIPTYMYHGQQGSGSSGGDNRLNVQESVDNSYNRRLQINKDGFDRRNEEINLYSGSTFPRDFLMSSDQYTYSQYHNTYARISTNMRSASNALYLAQNMYAQYQKTIDLMSFMGPPNNRSNTISDIYYENNPQIARLSQSVANHRANYESAFQARRELIENFYNDVVMPWSNS